MLLGCIPNSIDFKHPADRRRYVFYCKHRGMSYELADFDKTYDFVYISTSADLNQWAGYKKAQLSLGNNVSVIFDLSDFYFAEKPIFDCLRSIYHYLVGRTSTLSFSYKKTLLKMIQGTDTLLCGSEEQKTLLSEFHSNVIVMRDYFGSDIHCTKSSYKLKNEKVINVLWEGFSHGGLGIFETLRDILVRLDGYTVNLHLVTDSKFCRFGGRNLCKSTFSVLEKIFRRTNVNFHLYDWNSTTFSAIASSCDIALIPLPDDPIMLRKPENKLLLLWSIGLPVLVSETRSYSRVMDAIGMDYACSNIDEWVDRIQVLASSEVKRVEYMEAANGYLRKHCSDKVMLDAWDTVFS